MQSLRFVAERLVDCRGIGGAVELIVEDRKKVVETLDKDVRNREPAAGFQAQDG